MKCQTYPWLGTFFLGRFGTDCQMLIILKESRYFPSFAVDVVVEVVVVVCIEISGTFAANKFSFEIKCWSAKDLCLVANRENVKMQKENLKFETKFYIKKIL